MNTPEFQYPNAISLEDSSVVGPRLADFTSSPKTYTLITGASRGIGKAIALECARKGRHLILVALPGDKLVSVKELIERQFPVQVHYYETDLTLPNAAEQLYNWCVTNNLSVSTLVNNAGLGQQGAFETADLTHKLSLLQLNMLVPVNMVHHFLPMLKRHSDSRILNVGSIASFMPIPYKCLYAASKTFVLSFSRSLRYELKDTSIKVSCLCPGPTLTNTQNQFNTRVIGRRGTLLEMEADQVALAAVNGMLAGKEIIVPGWKHKFIEFFSRCFPASWTIPYSGKMFSVSRQSVSTNVP